MHAVARGASAIGGKMAPGFKAAASSIAMAAASAARMAAAFSRASARLTSAALPSPSSVRLALNRSPRE